MSTPTISYHLLLLLHERMAEKSQKWHHGAVATCSDFEVSFLELGMFQGESQFLSHV